MIKKKYLKGKVTPQWLRHQYTKRIKPWQVHRYFTNPQIIENGGWHFSFAISPEKIRFKMKAYGHGELNTEKFTDIDYIKKRIDSHMDVFSNTNLKKVEIDDTFPEYIRENKEKFKDFIA